MKLVLKELNESRANLKIIHKANLQDSGSLIQKCIKECGELIKIFESSIQTAKKRARSKYLVRISKYRKK
jgi:hypothetical protein